MVKKERGLSVLKEGNVKTLSRDSLHKSKARIMILTEGYLQWFSPSGCGAGRGREKGRIALDTILDVRPADKTKPPCAFEVDVGSEPGRSARLVVPVKGEEVVLNLQIRRVFEAESVCERDAWVAAIARARRHALNYSPPTPPHHNHSTSASSHRQVRLVTCMGPPPSEEEVVLWRGHGDTQQDIPLGPLNTAHTVLVWVDLWTHACFSGDTIAMALQHHTPTQAPLSDGRGVLSCRFSPHVSPWPWYTRPTVLATCLAPYVAWRVLPLVCVLGVCVVCLMLLSSSVDKAMQELGHVILHLQPAQAPLLPSPDEPNGPLLPPSPPHPPLPAFPSSPMQVPSLFVRGCVGDVQEARKKWEHAYKWRQHFQLDKILSRPHPQFPVLMGQWPQLYLNNAKNGDAVFLDKLGPCRFSSLLELGISAEDLMHHMAFMIEFSLKHQRPDPSRHLQLCIHDLDGVGIPHLDPRGIAYLRRLTSLWQQYYVGHERAVLLINAPAIFPIIWNVARRFVNQTKRRNMYVASKGKETTALLSRFMHLKDIPSEYGGQLNLPQPIEDSAHLLRHQAHLLKHMEALQRAHPHVHAHMPIV